MLCSWRPVPWRARCDKATSTVCKIERLGPTDSVTKLDVGGKLFTTMRSTLAHSPVLMQHVAAAEANKALMTEAGGVFVDRDPEVFPLVLQHLRNVSAGISRPGRLRSLRMVDRLTVEIDSLDVLKIKELYYEAAFYGLPELEQQAMVWAAAHKIWS